MGFEDNPRLLNLFDERLFQFEKKKSQISFNDQEAMVVTI